MRLKDLTQWIQSYIEAIPSSRVHKLNTFGDDKPPCFVKRDDELSFGISGTKLRKYSSLLPFLKKTSIKEAILIGNPYSNHVLSLTQLLIENGIKPLLFLLKNRSLQSRSGNFLLLSLFASDDQIKWISEEDWPHVDQLAREYRLRSPYKNSFLIPQGAYMAEAFPGALTLPLDILENERSLGCAFSNVFIEAGTGLSAIALILGFAYLKKETKVHVILLADSSTEFLRKLEEFRDVFCSLLPGDISLIDLEKYYEIHLPPLAPSFGATNAQVFKELISIARQEGFFTDPIYSLKLFYTSRRILREQNFKGASLLIHSGGGLTLMGFEKQLQKALRDLRP